MNPSNPYICVKNKVRGRAGVARQAHNLEVAGSNPVPATIFFISLHEYTQIAEGVL